MRRRFYITAFLARAPLVYAQDWIPSTGAFDLPEGFVDKYIGDAIMALFQREASDAVRCVIAMLDRLESLNDDAKSEGSPEVRICIGIHTGKTILGIVGESERYQGAMISDAVNLVSRLESLTKRVDYPVLISGTTFAAVKNEIPLKYVGKTETTRVYTLESFIQTTQKTSSIFT